MSRNNDRSFFHEDEPPKDSDPAPMVASSAQNESTSGTDFQWSIPTEVVSLPSAGQFYTEGHPLHNKTSVEIRYMTAKEEDILSSRTLIKEGVAVDRMLQNLLIDKSVDINSLLLGDKNALIIASRITGYGPEYKTKVTCPSCSSTNEHTFDLTVQNTNDITEGLTSTQAALTNEGTFTLTLPLSKATIECKFLTGHDEVRNFNKNKKRHRAARDKSNLTDSIFSFIVSINGTNEPVSMRQFVDRMPARDSKFLRNAYNQIAPNVDLTQIYECAECGYEAALEVPLTVDFFWPK